MNSTHLTQAKISLSTTLPSIRHHCPELPSKSLRPVTMGRIRQMIAVDGRECWTLFHPCTRNTYVIPSVAEFLKTVPTSRPIRAALGGTMKESNRLALLEGEIQHYPFRLMHLLLKRSAPTRTAIASKSCSARWL